MLNKIMSFLGYEKKSSSINVNVSSIEQMYMGGLSPLMAQPER